MTVKRATIDVTFEDQQHAGGLYVDQKMSYIGLAEGYRHLPDQHQPHLTMPSNSICFFRGQFSLGPAKLSFTLTQVKGREQDTSQLMNTVQKFSDYAVGTYIPMFTPRRVRTRSKVPALSKAFSLTAMHCDASKSTHSKSHPINFHPS
jgi:hypothetical protein